MAALELHCGVDTGVCVWSGECVDSLDSFDYEMQQWEEQLQDVQRKIEELYKVVEARRGASELPPNSNAQRDITLLPVSNVSSFPNNGCYGGNVNNVPALHTQSLHQSTGESCRSRADYPYGGGGGAPDGTMDIRGINSAGFRATPGKTRGTATTSSDQIQKLYTDTVTSGTGCVALREFEEAKNRKNNVSVWDEPHVRHVGWKEPVSKPPIRQRDSPHVPSRSAHCSDSAKGPLLDRRCGSPSVLRKFGAMLQENEGKTLIEDGFVTTLVPNSVPRSPKPGGSRGGKHAEGPVTLQNWENRGAKTGVKTPHWGNDSTHTDFKMSERILGNYPTPSPRNTPSPQQASCDSSPSTRRRSFSRPARPSNQRPPSRWASHAPTATITTPVTPRSRSLSPACKSRQRFHNYAFYTETVIM